jgi:hypothetical protein
VRPLRGPCRAPAANPFSEAELVIQDGLPKILSHPELAHS